MRVTRADRDIELGRQIIGQIAEKRVFLVMREFVVAVDDRCLVIERIVRMNGLEIRLESRFLAGGETAPQPFPRPAARCRRKPLFLREPLGLPTVDELHLLSGPDQTDRIGGSARPLLVAGERKSGSTDPR